ncbi:MAG: DUF5063 domain-containing protein [Streptosporangiales bacterium]|nr:DUF5063 domain-containing protein [Streptosporangiales bacterium]
MSDEWTGVADRVAGQVEDFLGGLSRLASGEGGDQTVPLLLLEVSQILLAGAQLGASADVILTSNWEPDVGPDPDIDTVREGLAKRLAPIDEYVEVFDPYSDTKVTPYRLSDDLADVAVDLVHGMQHYQAGRPTEALWWWQFSYFNNWGNHAGAALRALQAVVAHSRLDVPQET